MHNYHFGCLSSWAMISVLWFQIPFLLVLAIPEHYSIVGRQAALPCNVSHPGVEDTVTLVIWYKGDLKSPIYTLDARKGLLDEARHFPGNDMGSRARFDVKSVPALLYLEPLHAEDDGTYRCRVEFKRSRTVTEFMRLHVVVPPKEVVIMNERGMRLRDVIGPYDEGDRVVILCEAEGIPSPEVTWWRETSLVDDSYFYTVEGYVRNELTLPKIQRYDLLVSYSCNASNTNLTGPAVSTIMIDINLKALDVQITSNQMPFVAGRKIQLECQAWGARPKASLTWWINQKKVQFGKETVSHNLTTSTLSFVPTPDDNGKSISCTAENPVMSSEIIKDTWNLDIEYAPEIEISLGANIYPSAIKEGNDVFLECHVRANPAVAGVRWFFEGKPILSDISKGLIISNRSLVLQKVKRANRGRYKCSAFNNVGESESGELFLAVKYAPVCVRPRNVVYGVSNYESINVTCEVDADPTDVNFRWAFNNTLECIEIQTVDVVNGTTSMIVYTPGIMFGYGVLLCWGSNVIGNQKEPCIMKIVPAGPPEPVIGCRIVNQSSSSLRIHCKPGFDGGLLQKFHLEIYTSSMESLQANLSSLEAPVYFIDHLLPATSYILVMYSSNSKGKSSPVVLMAKTYALPRKRTEQSDRNISNSSGETANLVPFIASLVGGITLLIFVSLIVTFIILKRKSRRHPEKSSLGSEEVSSKYDIPLKKDFLAISDSNVESPDVIPNNSEQQTHIDDKENSQCDTDASFGFTKSAGQSCDYITTVEQ